MEHDDKTARQKEGEAANPRAEAVYMA